MAQNNPPGPESSPGPMTGAGLTMAPNSGLGPVTGAPPSSSALAPAVHPMLGHLAAVHDQAKATYDKLQESDGRLRAVRTQLDSLTKLGDMVSQEDVVKAAGHLVGSGLGAAALAGLLSEMPADGEALQAWVQQQDQAVGQREAMASQQLALARHQMGVAALRQLIGHAAAPHGDELAGPSGPGQIQSPGTAGQGTGTGIGLSPGLGTGLTPSEGVPNAS